MGCALATTSLGSSSKHKNQFYQRSNMKITYNFLFVIFLFFIGCSNQEEPSKQNQNIKLNKTLKEAALADVIYNEEVFKIFNNISAESYFYYKNRDEIKNTLIITDSIRIEKYSAATYKFQISGMEFFKSNWYIQIDDGYFPTYVSEYNADEKFNSENVELAKAMIKKCSEWDKKNDESKWWKLLK